MWFEPRARGFGWNPSTWQGWAVLGAFLLALGAISYFGKERLTRRQKTGLVLVAVAALIAVIWWKGGSPIPS